MVYSAPVTERSIMYLSDNYKDKIMTYIGHYENEIN